MARKLSKKARKEQIIENLTRSIELGGNSETIEKLKEILESVKMIRLYLSLRREQNVNRRRKRNQNDCI